MKCCLDYDPFDLWPSIATDIESKIPLRNLQWVESYQYKKHTITSLDLEFLPWLEEFSSQDTSKDPTLLNIPLVNMLFLLEQVSTVRKVDFVTYISFHSYSD